MSEPAFPVIGGATRVIGFAGYPTEQGRSPQLLNERFRQRGMDCVVVPLKVPPENLEATLRALAGVENALGCIVTIPHKRAALRVAGAASEQARLTDLANAVRWYPERDGYADQLDGAGFVTGVSRAGHSVEGRSVFLCGAGGAGRAIAFALAQAGVRHITVHDVNEAAAEELRAQLCALRGGGFAERGDAPAGGDSLVVNACPVGMRPGDPMPIDPASAATGAVLADVIMSPEKTAWLAAGEDLGHPVVTGLSMLHGQFEALEAFLVEAYRHSMEA